MPNDLTLVFLGAPRTASKSLWDAMSKHPQIAASREKEPFNNTNKKYMFTTDLYLDYFDITDETKILLDATPSAYFYYYEIVKRMEYPIKIIYPYRDPFDRIYSTIKQTIISHANHYFKRTKYPDFITGRFKIDETKLIDYIPTLLDSRNLEYAFKVTDDVFIDEMHNILAHQGNVFKFLGIDHVDLHIRELNKMNQWNTKNPYKEIREKVSNWFYKNPELIKMIQDDYRKSAKYGLKRRFNLVSVCATTKCNAYCSMCSRTERAKAGKLMSADMDLEILFKILPRTDFLSLNGIYGDFVLHPNALAFLQTEEARRVPLIEIATNGASKNDSFWSQLGEIPNVRVVFGIDGLEDTHHIYRGTSYKRVMHNMKTYIKSGGTAIWQFIVFQYNQHQIQEASALAKELGCCEFMPIRSNVYNDEFKQPTLESLDSRNDLIDATKKLDYCYWRQREWRPFYSFFVDVYGYVHPCCHTGVYIGPYHELPIFDDLRELWKKNEDKLNLKNNEIDDIIHNEYFRHVEDNFRDITICNKKCYGKVDEEIKRCGV